MSGYWAVGSLPIATAPAIVVRIAMTIAMIGRRTKNAPIGYVPAFSAVAGSLDAVVGTTVIPDFTRWIPSTTIRSPGLSPSSTTYWLPSGGPSLTTLIVTLLAESTNATW